MKYSNNISCADWEDELKKLLDKDCTDSDVEDFIEEHRNINNIDVWNFVYEYKAPEGCKSCKYIQMTPMYPCCECSRRINVKDYYEAR